MRAVMGKVALVGAAAVSLAAFGAIDDAAFRAPPRMFAPHVWWHWMNGNISKEGITADLEALADVGIAAATLFDASCGIEPGPVKFDTPEFYDAVRHAAKEAKRLGLFLGVANCSGWANSGGPWVRPCDSMKFVTVSETAVAGPSRFEGTLPRTKDDNGFYGDIAVVAVKDHSRAIDVSTSISGNVATVTAAAPVTAAGFSWRMEFPWTYAASGTARVEASDDGVSFRVVEELPFTIAYFNTSMWNEKRHTFKRPLTFRALRFTVLKCTSRKAALAEFRPETEQRIEDIDGKTYRYKKPLEETVIHEPDGSALAKGESVDLSARMSPDGRIAWDVPAGRWRILRFGYCSSGKMTSKSGTEAGRGLEVDRFDAAAVARHFEAYVGKVKRLLGEDADAVRMVLNDSYEAESQNWTQGFEREFERSAGYPILPYLPALTGRIVGSVAETERFLADFRRALSCAFVEKYVRTLYSKAHEYGMELYLEPYGNGPFDDFQYARYCDVPMCEFWSSERTDRYSRNTGPVLGNVEMVVKAADAWGHGILGAEAFTVGYDHGKWQVTPHSIKCQCDHAYELGVNRIVYHRFVHQPWKTPKYPGMTMGPWGMHFDRTQTWWKEAGEFVRYQTRCQYMLQQGRKMGDDVCHRQDTEADWYFLTSAKHTPTTVEKSFPFDGRVPEIWYPETGEAVRAARWRVEDGRVSVSVRLPTAGSAFVVFRSADPGVPAEKWLEEVSRADVPGPWSVSFSSPAGCEPAPTTFGALVDWSLSADRRLKYFSGSAHYRRTIDVPALKPGERLLLDLGDVRDFATVTVNGREHPALWKPPYRVDITDDVKPQGRAELSVKVTNRWPNRLIGDDALPEAERGTWTSWRHWKSDDKPLPSGLLGPVTMVTCGAAE